MDTPTLRKIIHIDMDAFYASIEQRDNPDLQGKAVAVGRGTDRGVVTTASYEARKYGVRSAMAVRIAREKCPPLIVVPPRFDLYREISGQIRGIFSEYTDLVEPLSLDEAFLDVTVNRCGLIYATDIARDIKEKIRQKTGLTASAGVSVNKFIAKIASDYHKPDGIFVVPPHRVEAFAESLKIEQFWGVGKVTAAKMHELGIFTGKDLKVRSEGELLRHFGKAGSLYYQFARGIDHRPVTPDRPRKSLGGESTFLADIGDREQLLGELYKITGEVWSVIETKGFYGRTVTVKAKYEDFKQVTRQKSYVTPVKDFQHLWRSARELFDLIDIQTKKIRLLGVTVSNAEGEPTGQFIFDFGEEDVVDLSREP